MNKVLFVKASSRLGMINIPHKGTTLNIGVENGPDAILSVFDWTELFETIHYTFPLPENINKEAYTSIIAASTLELKNLILQNWKDGEKLVLIGGDHSTAFSSLLADLERFKDCRVGYIQIDTHGDINQISTSHTGNFHGMWLRPFIGDFDDENIQNLVETKLSPKDILYIGNMDLDPEETRFIESQKIPIISSQECITNFFKVKQHLSEFINKYDHLHISFDIDVFDKSLVSATGTPAENGFLKDEMFEIIKILKTARSFSLDLVEVNPEKLGAEETIRLAREVLQGFIEN